VGSLVRQKLPRPNESRRNRPLPSRGSYITAALMRRRSIVQSFIPLVSVPCASPINLAMAEIEIEKQIQIQIDTDTETETERDRDR
jgi:hypothetical protein